MLGLCIPTSGSPLPPVEYLTRLKQLTGVQGARFDWHVDNPLGLEWFERLIATGWDPWPVISIKGRNDKPTGSATHYGDRFADISYALRHRIGQVFEFDNEWLIMGGNSPEGYAEYVEAGIEGARKHNPDGRFVICADLLLRDQVLTVGKFWRKKTWFSVVRRRLEDDGFYQYVHSCASHYYRDPRPPEYAHARFGGSRTREFEWVRQQTGKPSACTEVGWNKDELPAPADLLQRDYVMREIEIHAANAVTDTFIYAYQGPWGALDGDRPTPLSDALLARSQTQAGGTL